MIGIIDTLVLNEHLGVDVNKAIEDYQIANDCTEKEAIEAIPYKIIKR